VLWQVLCTAFESVPQEWSLKRIIVAANRAGTMWQSGIPGNAPFLPQYGMASALFQDDQNFTNVAVVGGDSSHGASLLTFGKMLGKGTL
jgi:hypothetical protein